MFYGYTGNILHVNLPTKETWIEHPSETFYRTYWGGRTLALYYMLREIKPHTDPLSPDNLLIFAPGILTGTPAPAMPRYTVCAKSPLTGMFGMAISSGSVGAQARRAGVNLIVFKGKAPEPVYMVVDDDDYYLVPCEKTLWGKGCWETEELLREEFEDQRLAVMSIGPAGERMSRIACITNDRNRQAGRTGRQRLCNVAGYRRADA